MDAQTRILPRAVPAARALKIPLWRACDGMQNVQHTGQAWQVLKWHLRKRGEEQLRFLLLLQVFLILAARLTCFLP